MSRFLMYLWIISIPFVVHYFFVEGGLIEFSDEEEDFYQELCELKGYDKFENEESANQIKCSKGSEEGSDSYGWILKEDKIDDMTAVGNLTNP